MKKTILFGLITVTFILSGCNKKQAEETAETVTNTITIENETENKESIEQPSEQDK